MCQTGCRYEDFNGDCKVLSVTLPDDCLRRDDDNEVYEPEWDPIDEMEKRQRRDYGLGIIDEGLQRIERHVDLLNRI